MSDVTYVMLYDRFSSSVRIVPEDEPKIEAGVLRWLGQGDGTFLSDEQRDSLLSLIALGGAPYKVLASTITSWCLMTPDWRVTSNAIDAAIKRETETAESGAASEVPA